MDAITEAVERRRMNRREAIERIKAFRDYLCGGNPIWDVDECKEAFDMAIAAMGQRWIPVKTRPMDEEERAEWSEKLGYDIEYEEAVIYTSQLPEEKREVLICTSDEFIYIGEYEKWTWADGLGTWTESVEYRTISDVVAWMPLPEPYKEENKC